MKIYKLAKIHWIIFLSSTFITRFLTHVTSANFQTGFCIVLLEFFSPLNYGSQTLNTSSHFSDFWPPFLYFGPNLLVNYPHVWKYVWGVSKWKLVEVRWVKNRLIKVLLKNPSFDFLSISNISSIKLPISISIWIIYT